MFSVPPQADHACYSQLLCDWQRRHGRHDLPWQQEHSAYRIWLSEIMLQQTQAGSVIPYYQRFLARFPDLPSLAAAPLESVMACWSGLGYYARARNLHRCAQIIISEYAGIFPADPQRIQQLPGIGRSTAHAIAVFAFGARAAILDGNVKRILCRSHGVAGYPGATAVERQLWELAEQLLPVDPAECATHIQAQMDLGASLCRRSKPDCPACPLNAHCVAWQTRRCHELPQPRPRKTLPERHCLVLLLQDESGPEPRWLLERRPSQGIWGGLLSLPEAPDLEAIPGWLATPGKPLEPRLMQESGQANRQEPPQLLAALRHSFSHFHLRLQPVLLKDIRARPLAAEAERYLWLNRLEIENAALPAPIRRILQTALDTSADSPGQARAQAANLLG